MDEDVKEMCSKFCFNTDDGIRRATTVQLDKKSAKIVAVSIPMTVLGGLQPSAARTAAEPFGVSIPMTVLGGLQLPWKSVYSSKIPLSFNTDDGIRRATTLCP